MYFFLGYLGQQRKGGGEGVEYNTQSNGGGFGAVDTQMLNMETRKKGESLETNIYVGFKGK